MNALQAITIDGFAGRFGIGRVTVYKEIARGRLKAKKIGRRTIIAQSDAQDWFAALPAFVSEMASESYR